jgi:ParB-like chromosome segregation protein Spo0J
MSRVRLVNAALTTGVVPVDMIAPAQHAAGDTLRQVAPGTLARSPWQPRARVVRDAEFDALVASIAAHGVLEPLLARLDDAGALELVAGERRLEAAKAAGLAVVPVRVLAGLDAPTAQAVALTENLARQNLTAWDAARAVCALRDARAAAGLPADVRTLGAVAGRDRTTTAQLLDIGAQLTPAVVAAARSRCGVNDIDTPDGGGAVNDIDTLPRATLYSIATAPTDAARVQALAVALRRGALPKGRPPARVVPAWRVVGAAGAPRGLVLRAPVGTLTPADAAAALAALAPLVAALTAQAGVGGPDAGVAGMP